MNSTVNNSFDWISHRLSLFGPEIRDVPGYRRAAVALILARIDSGYRMLFIERATHPGDPWSGNIGFPGGKVEKEDADTRHAAERETMEELGIDLAKAKYLGRISDHDGAHLPVLLSCFVYGIVEEQIEFTISEEVKDVFWLTIEELTDSDSLGVHEFTFAGDRFESPCVRLPYDDKPVLWGLTYRLVTEFLEKTGKLKIPVVT
jgi:8-oxo-dGTP pyrophosphatase MutT (NUDIX family)